MSAPSRTARRSLAVPLALLLVAGGFLLALLGAHVDPPHYAAPPAASAGPQPTAQAPPTQAPPNGPDESNDSPSRPLHEVGDLVLGMYIALVAGCLVALLVLLAHALSVRSARARRAGTEMELRGHDLQPELVAQAMADAAAAGLDELAAEGPVADAIIACWQRLRAAAAEAGLPPVPSDTPEQAIARVVRAGAVSDAAGRPLATLAGLYREARFSDHAMSRGDVWVAREALRTIVAQLRPEGSDAR